MIRRFRQGRIKSIGLMALPESELRSQVETWSDDEFKATQTFYRDKFLTLIHRMLKSTTCDDACIQCAYRNQRTLESVEG